MQVYKRFIVLSSVLLLGACGGSRSSDLQPAVAGATVGRFMEAVQDSNLATMGDLWGSERGPASAWMDRIEMRQRLTVIQSYLKNEGWEVTRTAGAADLGGVLAVEVSMVRNGCRRTVPFAVIEARGRHLIENIDLTAAGNPAVRCNRS